MKRRKFLGYSAALAATERLESQAAIPAVELQRFPLAAVEYADRLYRRDQQRYLPCPSFLPGTFPGSKRIRVPSGTGAG